MDLKRMGNQTVVFANPPVILSSYSVVGPKEGEGPLKNTFNQVRKDQINGEGVCVAMEQKTGVRSLIIPKRRTCLATEQKSAIVHPSFTVLHLKD